MNLETLNQCNCLELAAELVGNGMEGIARVDLVAKVQRVTPHYCVVARADRLRCHRIPCNYCVAARAG